MAADADTALGVLSDRNRRVVYGLLGQGPSSVGQLAAKMSISRPAVSQHLKLLKSCGLVRSHSRGTQNVYEIDPESAAALIDHLRRLAFPWPSPRPRVSRRPESAAAIGSGPPAPLTGSTTVLAAQVDAFDAFTTDLHAWWPTGFHLGATEPVSVGIEPRVGGRWYELAADGSRREWGRVITWDSPHLLVATWQIDHRWRYDPDPDHASEIAVRFRAAGEEWTMVELEHRRFDRLVGGSSIRGALEIGSTWHLLLTRYARHAADRIARR